MSAGAASAPSSSAARPGSSSAPAVSTPPSAGCCAEDVPGAAQQPADGGVRDVFRAEMALLYVEADSNGDPPFQLVEGQQVPAIPDLDRVLQGLRDAHLRSALLAARAGEPAGAMVAALVSSGGGYMGHLLVADRQPVLVGLRASDLRLLETLAAQAGAAIENERLERALIDRAYHDALTGLANRAQLLERVELALRRREGGSDVAVIFLDLDDFKAVNDSLGHSAGDDLLVAVAGRLRNCVRPHDVAARLGGDEFAIMVEVRHGLAEAVAVAERVSGALQEPFAVAERELSVRGSAGVVLAEDTTGSALDLLRDADMAMYAAKAGGKGAVRVFESAMRSDKAERRRMKADLHRALEDDELSVVYQPIVRLDTAEVVAAEALVRWQHPERGAVPPTDFVPLAEELGIAVPLGRRVLEMALADLRAWSALRPHVVVSVNVAPRQLEQAYFAWLVQAVTSRFGVDPRNLVLEVTEALMAGREMEAAFLRLGELRRLGVRVAVDDFGTGRASLGMLRDLPVDILKIATPFIAAIDRSERDLAFVEAICRLGASLGMEVIAEGVERAAQAERLREVGCRQAQGYLLGRPMSGGALGELLQAHPPITAAAVG